MANPSRLDKIQITANTNSGTATKVNVQEANGEVNTQTINTGFNKNIGLGGSDVVGANTLLNQYSTTPVDWTATAFNSGQVVFYGGKQWIAKMATVAGDVPSVSSKWEEITFESLANKTVTVDQTIIDGSTNSVSGNAVFDGLATKANDSNVIHTTGNETKTGNLGVNSLIVANNPIGSVANEIKQTIGGNDWWKIYGKIDVPDRSEMVFEVGDNGEPFSSTGQRYRFHYEASATGTSKDPVIIDYNDVTMDTNLVVAGNILTGGAVVESNNKDALIVSDSRTQATGVGGSILFKGVYTDGGTPLEFARISLMKENGINADSSFGLGLYTSGNVGSNPSATPNFYIAGNGSAYSLGNFESKGDGGFLLTNGSAWNIYSTADDFRISQTGVADRLIIDKITGNALIGTTVNNGVDKVQVAGTISASPATTANQVPTWGQVQDAALPYKLYTFYVNQPGTNIPTSVKLSNNTTLSSTPTWERTGVGDYRFFIGTVNTTKVFPYAVQSSWTFGNDIYAASVQGQYIQITKRTNGVLTDGLSNILFEIRQYP